MKVTRAHKIAWQPTNEQRQALLRAAGCARLAWNWGLSEWKRQNEAGEKPVANRDDTAAEDRRRQDAGALRFRGKVTGATVSRTAGRWFIAVQVEAEMFPCRSEAQAVRVGVDLGVKHLAVLSDGSVHSGRCAAQADEGLGAHLWVHCHRGPERQGHAVESEAASGHQRPGLWRVPQAACLQSRGAGISPHDGGSVAPVKQAVSGVRHRARRPWAGRPRLSVRRLRPRGRS